MKSAVIFALLCGAPQSTGASSVPTCDYPSEKVGSQNAQVCYHIFEAAAPQGHSLAEKNCAPAGGDVQYAVERGVDSYYYKAGYIARINYGVTEWSHYAHCKHRHGFNDYKCDRLDVRAGCSNCTKWSQEEHQMVTTMEPAPDAFLSFPEAGEDRYWSQVTALSGNCAAIIIRARCLFSLLAEAGVCPEGCYDKDADECNACFARLRRDEAIKVWHEAIEGGRCKRYTEMEGENHHPAPTRPSVPPAPGSAHSPHPSVRHTTTGAPSHHTTTAKHHTTTKAPSSQHSTTKASARHHSTTAHPHAKTPPTKEETEVALPHGVVV